MRFEELEARAHETMPASVVSYVAAGCWDERTHYANVAAFGKWGLVPRMLVGATERNLSIELFGMKLPTPLFMSPIGVIGLCAQDGHTHYSLTSRKDVSADGQIDDHARGQFVMASRTPRKLRGFRDSWSSTLHYDLLPIRQLQ